MAATQLWADTPAEHDYAAAADYLSLLADPATIDVAVRRLRAADRTSHKAKDVLRASRLALLPEDDAEVARDLKKVKRKEPLSPILLMRGGLASDRPLTIADGYHRVCAAYHMDEDAEVPCHLAELP